MHCIVLYYITVLYFIVLYYTSPYCTCLLVLTNVFFTLFIFCDSELQRVVLYCIVSYCIILCSTILFYINLLLCVECYCICTLLSSLEMVYFSIELFRILLSCYVLRSTTLFCYIILDCTVYYYFYFMCVKYLVVDNFWLFAYTSCNIFTLNIYRGVIIYIVTINICQLLVLLLHYMWFFRQL